MGDLECPLRAHWLIVRELTKGIGCVQSKLHALVGVDDLNAMVLKVGVICRHRPMSEQLVCTPNGISLSFRYHQNDAVLQVKTSVNAGMEKLVRLGGRMVLVSGERCECVKKEGCIKKQDTRLNSYVITMIIAGDLKYAANNENM